MLKSVYWSWTLRPLPAVGTSRITEKSDTTRRSNEIKSLETSLRRGVEGPLQRRKPVGESDSQDGQGFPFTGLARRVRGTPGPNEGTRRTAGKDFQSAG